jgi:hypothetical protein
LGNAKVHIVLGSKPDGFYLTHSLQVGWGEDVLVISILVGHDHGGTGKRHLAGAVFDRNQVCAFPQVAQNVVLLAEVGREEEIEREGGSASAGVQHTSMAKEVASRSPKMT